MKNFKILALALFALSCNPPPAPAPQDAAPLLEDSAVVDPFVRRPHPSTLPVASPDTRSAVQIAQAACTSADGTWRCASKRPVTFAATGNSPIIPISWTVPAWFVDPQNTSTTASDQNDCVTSATACRTYQEISVHRWGCLGNPSVCPRLRQSTSVTFLSSHTNNSDPVYFTPGIEAAALVSIQGTAPTVVASGVVLAGTTAKSTVAGANSLLITNLGASGAIQLLVENTTALKSSRAWAYKSLGGNSFDMTQPFVKTTVGGTPFPAEVNTWANTDTVNLLRPVAVNIVEFNPITADTGAFANQAFLYQLRIFDPTGAGNDTVQIGDNVNLYEVTSDRIVSSNSNFATASANLVNVYNNGGLMWQTGFLNVIGGCTAAAGVIFNQVITGQPFFDGDYINGTAMSLSSGASFGQVFLDSNVALASGQLSVSTIFYSSGVVYGSSGKNLVLQGSSRLAYPSGAGAAVAAFTAPQPIIGILVNGSATAYSVNTGAGAVWNGGISTTPSHLDAAQGAAGFGGKAIGVGGASIANSL